MSVTHESVLVLVDVLVTVFVVVLCTRRVLEAAVGSTVLVIVLMLVTVFVSLLAVLVHFSCAVTMVLVCLKASIVFGSVSVREA